MLFSLYGGGARAATVEPKVRVMVREKPSTAARIIDRVPAGKRMPLLGKNADGSWAHVDTGRHEGWVPSAQLRGKALAVPVHRDEDGDAEEEVVQRPLAKRRGVRAEAWVSSSRYHDGENNKLTVSSTKAELFGRPASGGTVVGVVRRGDVVDLVRRSSDRKWCLVDIGGGEVAWIDSRHVRAGAFRAAPADMQQPREEEEPLPPPTRKAKQVEVAEREPEPAVEEKEEPLPPPTPPPPAKKKGKHAKVAEPPAEEPPREEVASTSKEDEAPPLEDPAPRGKKGKKKKLIASRGDDGVRMAAKKDPEASLSATPAESQGNNYLGIGARAGIAIISQRFTSNGTGALTNYDAGTNAFGAQVGASYIRALGQYARLGLDGSYAFAGAAAVRYHAADGSTVQLGMQVHDINFGAQVGVHFHAIGGIDLRARIGGDIMMNLIQGSSKAPLPSDRIMGMTVGLALMAPSLLTLANRPLGVHLFGWALVPAQRAQTIGLEEGQKSSTIGASFGGGLSYGLYKGLAMEANYQYGFVLTHYTGQAKRNTSITTADRGNADHLITLGLAYNY
jgi:opacity protein-like surface antigen